VVTKLFRFRIKIRLKFQIESFLDYFPLSVQENLMFVSIDRVNVFIPKIHTIRVHVGDN